MLMSQEPKSSHYDTEDTMMELLKIARLSPSSHNTQPWSVHVYPDKKSIVIGFKPDRQLTVGDPNKRELFMSLGCFIATFVFAAKDMGFDTSYSFLGSNPEGVARLTLSKSKTTTGDKSWERIIRHRRSDRKLYKPTKIKSDDAYHIESLVYGHANTVLVQQESDIEFLAKMTHKATLEIMSRQEFRNELASWVRHNWTKSHDGMPGYTQGIPGPISLLAKFVIKKNKKVAIDQAKKDSKRVTKSAAIGLVCINEESPAAWLDAGQLYQRICLESLSREIKTSGVSAAVILPKTSKQIVKSLKLKKLPVALLRLGYSDKTPKATPRLNVEHFSQIG
jgi:hypothetical protein